MPIFNIPLCSGLKPGPWNSAKKEKRSHFLLLSKAEALKGNQYQPITDNILYNKNRVCTFHFQEIGRDPFNSMFFTSLVYLCGSVSSFPWFLQCMTGISRIIYCSNSGIQPHQSDRFSVIQGNIYCILPSQRNCRFYATRTSKCYFHNKAAIRGIISWTGSHISINLKNVQIWDSVFHQELRCRENNPAVMI